MTGQKENLTIIHASPTNGDLWGPVFLQRKTVFMRVPLFSKSSLMLCGHQLQL